MNEEFKTLILNNFQEIIKEHNFIIEDRNKTFFELKLINDKCILRFTDDIDYVIICDFSDPVEKKNKERNSNLNPLLVGVPVYSVFSIWRFLFPKDKEDYSCNGCTSVQQVLNIKNLILTRLLNVLNGDFSWVNDYKTNNLRVSNKIEHMFNHWAVDNPVRIAFSNGNVEWERMFDKYKLDLDNLLKYKSDKR